MLQNFLVLFTRLFKLDRKKQLSLKTKKQTKKIKIVNYRAKFSLKKDYCYVQHDTLSNDYRCCCTPYTEYHRLSCDRINSKRNSLLAWKFSLTAKNLRYSWYYDLSTIRDEYRPDP